MSVPCLCISEDVESAGGLPVEENVAVGWYLRTGLCLVSKILLGVESTIVEDVSGIFGACWDKISFVSPSFSIIFQEKF